MDRNDLGAFLGSYVEDYPDAQPLLDQYEQLRKAAHDHGTTDLDGLSCPSCGPEFSGMAYGRLPVWQSFHKAANGTVDWDSWDYNTGPIYQYVYCECGAQVYKAPGAESAAPQPLVEEADEDGPDSQDIEAQFEAEVRTFRRFIRSLAMAGDIVDLGDIDNALNREG